MSLSSPRPAQTLADHYEAVCRALVEVAECSFAASVSRSNEEQFRDAAKRVQLWIGASVLFEAALSGAVLIVMPETLARGLFQSGLGVERGVIPMDGRLFDLVGEVANMVCGAWLARTVNHHYDWRPPEISRLQREQVTPGTDCLLVTIDKQPCLVRLAFHDSPS